MAKKSEKKAQDNLKARIPEAAMVLAAELGWTQVGLADVAKSVGLSLADLYAYVDDKADILVLLGRHIDRQVLEAMGEAGPDLSVSPRDRLFDLLMERYEVLNAYREGLCSVLESFRFDPKQALISCPHLCRSMSWMLEAAGIGTGGVRGALKVAGLSALYVKNLRVWCVDDTPDMSRLMAVLDKDLGRAECWAAGIKG